MADQQQLGLDLEPKPPRQKRGQVLESFHVRSHVTAEEAAMGEAIARGQEITILAFFRQYPDLRWTPEIHERALARAPLTSVRRAGSDS